MTVSHASITFRALQGVVPYKGFRRLEHAVNILTFEKKSQRIIGSTFMFLIPFTSPKMIFDLSPS